MLKIDRKSYKDIGIHNIGYIAIKKIDDCENIYRVNPLYLLVSYASGYIEEKCVNKYLIFDFTDENKELLKKYNDVWNGIKSKIEEVVVSVIMKKITWKLNLILMITYQPLKFHNMNITIRSVFKEDGKLYPQVFLDDTLYELNA